MRPRQRRTVQYETFRTKPGKQSPEPNERGNVNSIRQTEFTENIIPFSFGNCNDYFTEGVRIYTVEASKIIKTDYGKYYAELEIDEDENTIYVYVYSFEKYGFLIPRRELLASRRFPLWKDGRVDVYISELIREYETPRRILRDFEEWDGYVTFENEERPEPKVINNVKINGLGEELINAFFDKLSNKIKTGTEPEEKKEIPVYHWFENERRKRP